MVKRTAQMLRFTLMLMLELMGAMIAGLVVVIALLSWRLSDGPMRLEALQPYLMAGLTPITAPYRIALGSTSLSWLEDDDALGIIARDVRLVTPEGQVAAAFPAIEVGFSVPALLIARPAPAVIRLSGPQLRAMRTPEGTVQLSLQGTTAKSETADTVMKGDVLSQWLTALTEPRSSTSLFGALRRVEIEHARLEVLDYQLGVRWFSPSAEFQLARDRAGLRGAIRAEVDLGAHHPMLNGRFLYDKERADLRMRLDLDRFNPADIAGWSPSLASLARINVPLSGALQARWTALTGISQIEFDLSAGEGTLGAQLNDAPLALNYAQLKGIINRQAKRVDIQQLHIDFGGVRIDGSANAVRDGDNQVLVTTSTTIKDMPAKDLGRYWLPAWAKNARDWVTQNITDGFVPEAEAQVRLALPLDAVGVVTPLSLEGGMRYEGLAVHYFRPLPPATAGRGRVQFDLSGFRIHVDEAQVGKLPIVTADVNLLGLNNNTDRAEIDVTVNGAVADQLALIDHEPLGYAKRLGIKAAEASGVATTRAQFFFPLFSDLPIDDVAIAVASNLKDVKIPKLVAGQDLTQGQLGLRLDGGGMSIDGTGQIGPAPAKFTWQESFVDDVSPSTEIQFEGALDEEARQAFNLSWPEVIAERASVTGTYTKDVGQPALLSAQLDLTPAVLNLPWFGYHKDIGVKASAFVNVTVAQNAVKRVDRFTVSSAGLDVRGAISFRPQSQWQTVTFDKLETVNTHLTGSVTSEESGSLSLDFKGSDANIRALFDAQDASADAALKAARETGEKQPIPAAIRPMDIRFNIDRVETDANRMLEKAIGRLVRSSKGWTLLDITGIATDVPFIIKLVPSATGRSLLVDTKDAGAMLSTLRVLKNVHGGDLHIEGAGIGATGDVEATADLRDFRYLEAETLRKIAESAQPKGAEVLAKEEGVKFSRLKANLVYREDSLDIKTARIAGDTVGLSLSGQLDLTRSRLDLSGTFVPLYGINSLVSGIPVIGWLLTGGEGGGIFAATYTVKGPFRDPQTSVNPLSILAPGFLRELFFVESH